MHMDKFPWDRGLTVLLSGVVDFQKRKRLNISPTVRHPWLHGQNV